jgi:hypothetical protein
VFIAERDSKGAHDVDAFLKEVLHRLEQSRARPVTDARAG